ncbi:hypothetical protein VTK73DRAFT_3643 [Phialemonium thermophilum]|uniref:Uncharacterized protein n=1 Tax=Phialemonium thermophilum TaxID=223376 RepID=A0ABR3VGA4_9PEZI
MYCIYYGFEPGCDQPSAHASSPPAVSSVFWLSPVVGVGGTSPPAPSTVPPSSLPSSPTPPVSGDVVGAVVVVAFSLLRRRIRLSSSAVCLRDRRRLSLFSSSAPSPPAPSLLPFPLPRIPCRSSAALSATSSSSPFPSAVALLLLPPGLPGTGLSGVLLLMLLLLLLLPPPPVSSSPSPSAPRRRRCCCCCDDDDDDDPRSPASTSGISSRSGIFCPLAMRTWCRSLSRARRLRSR